MTNNSYYAVSGSAGIELYHYGVPGMKWGMRRGSAALSKNSGNNRAAARMMRLRRKGMARVQKATRKTARFQKKYDKANVKMLKKQRKIPSHYFTDIGKGKTEKYMRKAAQQQGKMARAQKKMDKQAKIQNKMNSNIRDIDKTMVAAGRGHAVRLAQQQQMKKKKR